MKIALLCKFDQLLTSCQYAHRPYPSCGHHNYMRISARSHKIARSRFMVRIEDARILQLCCLYRLVTWYLLLNVPIDQDLLRLSTQWCWKNWTCAILKIHCAIAKTKVLVKDLDWWLLKCCMLNPRWMSIPRLQFMTFLNYLLNKSDYRDGGWHCIDPRLVLATFRGNNDKLQDLVNLWHKGLQWVCRNAHQISKLRPWRVRLRSSLCMSHRP